MSYLKEVVLNNYKSILNPATNIKYLTFSSLFKKEWRKYARIHSAYIQPLDFSSFIYSYGMKNNTKYKTTRFNPKYGKHNYPELCRPLRYIKRLYFDNVKIFDDFYIANYIDSSIYFLLLSFILFEIDSIYDYHIYASLKNVRHAMRYIKERFAGDKSYIIVSDVESLIKLIQDDANKNEYSRRFLKLHEYTEFDPRKMLNNLYAGMGVIYNDTKYELTKYLIKNFNLEYRSILNILSYIGINGTKKFINFLKCLDNDIREMLVNNINNNLLFSNWGRDILVLDYNNKRVLLLALRPDKNGPIVDNTQIFKIGNSIVMNPGKIILPDKTYYSYEDIRNVFAYFDKTTFKVMDLTDFKMLLKEYKLQSLIQNP